MPYQAHLSKDRKLKKIIEQSERVELHTATNVYLSLCKSIISQQLSTKVAQVIYTRFLALYENKTPDPSHILDTSVEQLRSIGLSHSKANYIHNVCRFWMENKITDKQLEKMSDEEIIDKLTEIKGIGRWTVEMILMFTLGREDVFAVDDLGIQRAMCKLFNIDSSDKKQMKMTMIDHAEKWKPFRTYACIHLWRWRDDV